MPEQLIQQNIQDVNCVQWKSAEVFIAKFLCCFFRKYRVAKNIQTDFQDLQATWCGQHKLSLVQCACREERKSSLQFLTQGTSVLCYGTVAETNVNVPANPTEPNREELISLMKDWKRLVSLQKLSNWHVVLVCLLEQYASWYSRLVNPKLSPWWIPMISCRT